MQKRRKDTVFDLHAQGMTSEDSTATVGICYIPLQSGHNGANLTA